MQKPGALVNANPQAVPGSSSMETGTDPQQRKSSIDSAMSAMSAMSTGSSTPKNAQDIASSPADIAKLVKAAGSPDAVIQYLLREKQSQAQQNAQLWRLVDKQRAMILGLNKDLERSLKDKEKYRKKLKEVLVVRTTSPSRLDASGSNDASAPPVESGTVKATTLEIPASPSVGSDSAKLSPVDVALAPYPITPPADQCSNGPSSGVGEMLDPLHAMPEASEHAVDKFDHEADERQAEAARKQSQEQNELALNTPIPTSRPTDHTETLLSAEDDDGLSRFPAPPMPPRKPPPAPLQLKETVLSSTLGHGDDDSDLDSEALLRIDEIATEKRGRRRTRQEDDELREVIALREAEARSLSKKSKQSTPRDAIPGIQAGSPMSSPPIVTKDDRAGIASSLSVAGSHNSAQQLSPGLPASLPRSPRDVGGAPLSPRPARQPVLQTPSPHESLVLKSPQPLHIVKKRAPESESLGTSTPTSSRESAAERTKIYKGFMTDEYPDLLIPPDALLAIHLKVASSRMKPSRASLISLTQLEEDPVFTLAVISRADGGELWRVEKDSVSLAKLDTRLKHCPEFTARTPDRSLFSGHAPAKLDARRRALDTYLEECLNSALDKNASLDLCRYLSTNVLPPNADEMGSGTGPDEEGATRLGPGGRQFKSGYLTKRGKNFGGWKARFFSVEGPQLKYYETPGGAHLGTIKLQGAKIGKQSHQLDANSPTATSDEADNQYRHAFLVLEPKKKDPTATTKHVLCAESDKERDLWVSVLLPWTTYKDPADLEKKRDQHDRQGTATHTKGANAKKKMYGQSRASHHPKDSEETLIGVSYEATKQGDAPSNEYVDAPVQAPLAAPGPSYAISAPRDAHWVPDPALMNKMNGLVPPGMDEKKAKKRSFFGFGPKQRSSSDGADSLFGDSSSASMHQANGNQLGPVRRVFGAPLFEAVKFNSPRDVRVPLPAVVYRCIQYLDARGALTEEGIFRLSGSNVVIKQLKERFDNEGDINLLEDEQYHDIHAVASMLKAYLRELPTSILTRDLHLEFVAVTEMNSQDEKVEALSELVTRLPLANNTLLKYLIAFLIKIINHSDQNKMTVRNVGIVFSPTLTIPAPVFALFLQNYERIFGISPEEYELPTPGSANEQYGREPLDLPPRPSTSGGHRESPHRHRLAESLAEQRRVNTPPPSVATGVHPLAGFSQMRSTPTPPPGQRYELNPFAQQAHAGGISTRPAYESVILPNGFDPTQYYNSPQRQGYERAAAYDQPSTRASRRESAVIMGLPPRGITPQGSMSRLREEDEW